MRRFPNAASPACRCIPLDCRLCPRNSASRFGSQVRILRAIHFGSDAAQQAEKLAADPNIDAILVDSRTATAVGGTGQTFDWTHARTTVFAAPSPIKLIAAGGLTPANVARGHRNIAPVGRGCGQWG